MEITYTNIITFGSRQILFQELDAEEKERIRDSLTKTSLETLGTVKKKTLPDSRADKSVNNSEFVGSNGRTEKSCFGNNVKKYGRKKENSSEGDTGD